MSGGMGRQALGITTATRNQPEITSIDKDDL
jgi:hypothetical protein